MDATSAAARLGVSRARLYQLRTGYLKDKADYQPKASGGDWREEWPPEVVEFLKSFLPVQSPPNYQLVADEMDRLCNFKRARATVESYVKANLSHLVPTPAPKKRTCRRFRRAHIGELWQHDSSIHPWWPAPQKQTLLLTVDDCSGQNRLVTLMAHAEVSDWESADSILRMEIQRQSRKTGEPQGECRPKCGKSSCSNAPPA